MLTISNSGLHLKNAIVK